MGRLPAINPRLELAAPAGLVPTCVVDVRLSLGAGGLFWVMGLARRLPVWLVQTHWSIVEDPYHLGQDELVRWLAGEPTAPIEDCRGAVTEACEAWCQARRGWALETCPNLFWSAERLAEAVVPKDRDIGLVERRDALAAGLDQRCGRSPETVDALADCARDVAAQAVALAVAAVGAPPFVLTTLVGDEREPALVRTLNAAGVLCRRLEDGGWSRRFDEMLAPALVEAGLAAALAAGVLRLAAVQIVAPEALGALPTEDALGDTLGWDAAAQGDEARLWRGAFAACWEVRCAI